MKAIIFDLDGTLLNSLEDIALCMNQVLEELGLPTHELSKYNYFVGDGALVLSENATPDTSSDEDIQKVFERFKEVYDLGVHTNTKPYDGIMELLEELNKTTMHLGILSNKPHKFTLKYAQTFFSQFNFKEVHGQKEGIPKKPDPTTALQIAQSLNVKPEEIIYVGDTATDIKTAKNAGFKSIGVLWGFRTKEELVENGADYIVAHPREILSLVKAYQS